MHTYATEHSSIDSQVVHVTHTAPGYLTATFDNPPVNLLDPETVAGLRLLREHVEDSARDVRVVVFESANPDFFIAHVDFPRIGEDRT